MNEIPSQRIGVECVVRNYCGAIFGVSMRRRRRRMSASLLMSIDVLRYPISRHLHGAVSRRQTCRPPRVEEEKALPSNRWRAFLLLLLWQSLLVSHTHVKGVDNGVADVLFWTFDPDEFHVDPPPEVSVIQVDVSNSHNEIVLADCQKDFAIQVDIPNECVLVDKPIHLAVQIDVLNAKLAPKYHGPLSVKRLLTPVTVILEDESRPELFNKCHLEVHLILMCWSESVTRQATSMESPAELIMRVPLLGGGDETACTKICRLYYRQTRCSISNVSAARNWNGLGQNIRDEGSYHLFKKKLMQCLLSRRLDPSSSGERHGDVDSAACRRPLSPTLVTSSVWTHSCDNLRAVSEHEEGGSASSHLVRSDEVAEGDRSVLAARLVPSGEPGSTPGAVTPGFSHLGSVLDDSTGQRIIGATGRKRQCDVCRAIIPTLYNCVTNNTIEIIVYFDRVYDYDSSMTLSWRCACAIRLWESVAGGGEVVGRREHGTRAGAGPISQGMRVERTRRLRPGDQYDQHRHRKWAGHLARMCGRRLDGQSRRRATLCPPPHGAWREFRHGTARRNCG
ncbi:hypothetical protein PR048_010149 [Dryococelus australis]|uniref:Uncharacterized protein n=1 Tax=Dryococelus australis TaxID=614101 RepID=A0ABQ9I1W5_9NEOP|nr:hypothetical protein PR048_010149 [Dryococelus australis]